MEPQEILLVVDSMTGQEAVNVAKSFDELLNITGVILTTVSYTHLDVYKRQGRGKAKGETAKTRGIPAWRQKIAGIKRSSADGRLPIRFFIRRGRWSGGIVLPKFLSPAWEFMGSKDGEL